MHIVAPIPKVLKKSWLKICHLLNITCQQQQQPPCPSNYPQKSIFFFSKPQKMVQNFKKGLLSSAISTILSLTISLQATRFRSPTEGQTTKGHSNLSTELALANILIVFVPMTLSGFSYCFVQSWTLCYLNFSFAIVNITGNIINLLNVPTTPWMCVRAAWLVLYPRDDKSLR